MSTTQEGSGMAISEQVEQMERDDLEDFAVSLYQDLEERLNEVESVAHQANETATEANERVDDVKDSADRAERVADTAIAHSRQLWGRVEKETSRIDSVQEFSYKTLQGRVSDLEHDRVDVSDLVNTETQTHDLEIQRMTAARLEADRNDKPSPLEGNKHRMTYLWRAFIENANKTKGGMLKLDSAACKTRLERYAGIRDPNTNTVQRAMKMLARHTRRDGGVSKRGEHTSDDNLVRFQPGERGEKSAALIADADEFREFCSEQARAATMEEVPA